MACVAIGHLLIEDVDCSLHVDTRRRPVFQLLLLDSVHEAFDLRRLRTRQRPQVKAQLRLKHKRRYWTDYGWSVGGGGGGVV